MTLCHPTGALLLSAALKPRIFISLQAAFVPMFRTAVVSKLLTSMSPLRKRGCFCMATSPEEEATWSSSTSHDILKMVYKSAALLTRRIKLYPPMTGCLRVLQERAGNTPASYDLTLERET